MSRRPGRTAEEAEYLRDLWENGDEEDKRHALEMLKDGCG